MPSGDKHENPCEDSRVCRRMAYLTVLWEKRLRKKRLWKHGQARRRTLTAAALAIVDTDEEHFHEHIKPNAEKRVVANVGVD